MHMVLEELSEKNDNKRRIQISLNARVSINTKLKT